MADTTKTLPKLRFPEFANDGEWEKDSMQTIFEIKNGYTPSKANNDYWANGTIPWFRMEDIRNNGHILSDSIQHITPQAVKGGKLFPAFSIIVATTATIGEHALVIVDSLANQRFTFLTKCKSFDSKIDMLYFHYNMFIIDEWCKLNTNAGGLLSVNMPAFKQLQIPIPPLHEQQKIASFLTSLDELISAHKKRLEALKAHKKSLMQQLFPANGEKTPKLRFPEFKNTGEWKVMKLREIADINPSSNKGLPAKFVYIDLESVAEGRLCLRKIVNLANAPSRAQRLVQDGDILFQMVRPYQKNNIIFKRFDNLDYVASTGYAQIRAHQSGAFLYQYMQSQTFVNDVITKCSGSNYPAINSADLSDSTIAIPRLPEQQKIASFLSSIDDMIQAQDNKIQKLKTYKNGLMQQMFANTIDCQPTY